MNHLEFDSSLYQKVGDCTDITQLKSILLELIEYYTIWQKVLNDVLSNLNSDNIAFLDYSKTKVSNIDQILGKYATKEWVNINFTKKSEG